MTTEVTMRATMTRRLVLAAVLLGVAPAARAELIVGNLSQAANTSFAVASPGDRLAARVDLDGTFAAHTLTSAVLPLFLGSGFGQAGLELFDDGGGQPGGLVADLGTVAVSPGLTDYTFTAGSPPTLVPAGSYWLVFRAGSLPSLEFLDWEATGGAALDPGSLPGASIPGGILGSIDAGASWTVLEPVFRFRFQLHGDPVTAAVPEPSTLALAAIGGAGLVGVIRRRKRA
jgi:hypothetical protein